MGAPEKIRVLLFTKMGFEILGTMYFPSEILARTYKTLRPLPIPHLRPSHLDVAISESCRAAGPVVGKIGGQNLAPVIRIYSRLLLL